jgi:hypothetical protein
MKAQLVAELKLRGKNNQPEGWLFYVVNDHGTFDMRYENAAEGVQLDPLRLQPCSFHSTRREAIAAAAARLADIEQLGDLLYEM